MRAYEFPVRVAADGSLTVPDDLLKLLPASRQVRVILLVNEPARADEKAAWAQVTKEQFLSGYSEQDAAYDTV